MAIAFVVAWTGVQNTSGASSLTTGAVDTTGANFLAAEVTCDVTGGTMSDNKGNTWSLAIGPVANGGDNLYIYYCKNPTVGSGHTLTFTPGGSHFSTISAAAYSGLDTSAPLDKTAQGTGNTGAMTTANTGTTAQADELLIGVFTVSTGTTVAWTQGSGFTIRSHVDNGAVGGVGMLEDQIVSATGAYAATGNNDQSANYVALIATFKAATGGVVNTVVKDDTLTLADDKTATQISPPATDDTSMIVNVFRSIQ